MGIVGGGVFVGKEWDGVGKVFVLVGLVNEMVGLFIFVLYWFGEFKLKELFDVF